MVHTLLLSAFVLSINRFKFLESHLSFSFGILPYPSFFVSHVLIWYSCFLFWHLYMSFVYVSYYQLKYSKYSSKLFLVLLILVYTHIPLIFFAIRDTFEIHRILETYNCRKLQAKYFGVIVVWNCNSWNWARPCYGHVLQSRYFDYHPCSIYCV